MPTPWSRWLVLGAAAALAVGCTKYTTYGYQYRMQQQFGGGINSSLSVALPVALAPGASVNLQYVLGVQTGGTFKFFVNIEALP